jgi:CubicO group peptidase (beta-lactamase class C family)
MTTWRLESQIEPDAAGLDGAVLDEMAVRFAEAAERGELFTGAQMAVYRNGRLVLGVGGGMARPRTGVPVTPETLFVIFSSTKGLAALAMWMLHERSAFEFDDPVVKYWPTFSSQVPEKDQVTIRHVMGHRGGFPLGPEWFTASRWGDREALVRAMEEAPLRWRPGEANGYHTLNFGWVQDDRHRETPELSIPWNRPSVHRAVVPGGGGISSARALAKVYAALALGGELDGVRILQQESIEQAIVPTNAPGEIDRIIQMPMRWGTGWHIGSAAEGATMRTFGHGGRGGQMGWADLDRGLAFGFTTTGQLKAEAYQTWLLGLQSLAFRACRD